MTGLVPGTYTYRNILCKRPGGRVKIPPSEDRPGVFSKVEGRSFRELKEHPGAFFPRGAGCFLGERDMTGRKSPRGEGLFANLPVHVHPQVYADPFLCGALYVYVRPQHYLQQASFQEAEDGRRLGELASSAW